MGKRSYRPVNGILLLDKAKGISSNKALQSVRHLFQAKKAGHTGSLDPLATGMLPICLGEATKVSAFLLEADKYYQTTAVLGKVSTTGDAEGELRDFNAVPSLTDSQWEQLLDKFRGPIEQVPSMYSALKKDGTPLYKLARQGIDVERTPRSVFIHALSLDNVQENRVTLTVHCSKGTYIRSLVEDIGYALGCGAYVESLRRLSVSPFEKMNCLDFDALEALAKQGLPALDALLMPADQALLALPSVSLAARQAKSLLQGQKLILDKVFDHEVPPAKLLNKNNNLESPEQSATLVRVYQEEDHFLGVGELRGQVLQPKRLFAYNS